MLLKLARSAYLAEALRQNISLKFSTMAISSDIENCQVFTWEPTLYVENYQEINHTVLHHH
jgi:hypothetical protein